MCEAVCQRTLEPGAQGWFLCFQGMFDICPSPFQRASNLPFCRVHGGLQELNG